MGRIAEKNQVNVELDADNILAGKREVAEVLLLLLLLLFFLFFGKCFPFVIAALSHLSFLKTHICSLPDRPPSVAPLNRPD